MASYDIGPRVGMEGVDGFQASTKLIESSLKALGSQMQLLCAEFEGSGQSMEFYAAKSELLEKTTAATADKLAAQVKQYGDYEQELRKIEQTLANAVGQQQAAANAVSAAQEAYKTAKTELESMGKSMQQLEGLIAETAAAYGEQSAEVSGLETRLASMQRIYASQEQTVAGLADELNQAKKAQLDGQAAVDKASRAYDTQAGKMNRLESEINKTKASMAKLAKESDETAGAMDDLEKSGSKMNKVFSGLESAVKGILGIKTNSEGAKDALKGAGEKALQFGDAVKAIVVGDIIKGGFDKLGSAISAVGGALKDAAGYALDFAKKGIEVASDLDEVQNVVDVTFGKEGAAAIEDFANSAASSFGMSALSAKEYTGTMGAMLKSMQLDDGEVLEMSQSLTGLAGDLASFYNLDIDEAFAKIRSGISGETEPLKQLGINMSVANMEAYALSQGITESWQDMDQASQAALRYSYLMSATADAQGDFARTSDSYANQQRIMQLNLENLSSTIGQKLLPTVTKMTSLFNGLLSGEMNLNTFAYSLGYELGNALNSLATNLPDMVEVGLSVVTSLVDSIVAQLPLLLPAVESILSTLGQGLLELGGTLLEAGGTILGWLKDGIMEHLPEWTETGTTLVVDLLQMLVDGLPDFLETGWSILTTLAEGIIEKIPDLVAMLPEIVSSIATFFTEHFPEFIEMAGEIVAKLAEGIVESIPEILQACLDLFEAVVAYFTERFIFFRDLGKNLVEGIWKGISEKWTWLKNKVTGWIGNFKSLFTGKDGFDTNSPSKWSSEVFGYVTEGAQEGLESGSRDLLRTARGVTDDVRDALTGGGLLGGLGYELRQGLQSVRPQIDPPGGVSGGGNVPDSGTGGQDGMVQAFREALAGAAVYMDGRKVGRLVSTSQSNTARAMGT